MGESSTTAVDWPAVWSRVAVTLGGHLAAGRGHLLSDDTVRMSTVLALEAVGVAPSRLAMVVPGRGVGERPALAVDGPDGSVVDLRCPHTATRVGRDTVAMGSLLHDFLRLALVPARQRLVTQLLDVRTMGYLRRSAERNGVLLPTSPGDRLVLQRDTLEWLPPGALTGLGERAWSLPVHVTCRGRWPVAGDLELFEFDVRGPRAAAAAPPGSSRTQRPRQAGTGQLGGRTASPSPAGSARAQIIEAMRALAARGRSEVGGAEVYAELQRAGSRYAEPTIHRLLTTHMCVDVRGRGIGSYDDVESVGPGLYRLRTQT